MRLQTDTQTRPNQRTRAVPDTLSVASHHAGGVVLVVALVVVVPCLLTRRGLARRLNCRTPPRQPMRNKILKLRPLLEHLAELVMDFTCES